MSVRTRIRAALLVLIGLLATLTVALSPKGEAAGAPVSSPNDAPAAAAALGIGKPTCGKATYRKANGDPWRCVFADDFNGTKLNTSKWTIITSKTSNFGPRPDCFVNSRYNIAVNSGVLKMVTRKNLIPFTCGEGKKAYTTNATSALVSTFGKFTQNRGRFSMRAKFPYTAKKGLQDAFWLFPEGGALGAYTSGEIDIAEWYSAFPRRVIPYLHYNLGIFGGSQVTNLECWVKNVGDWHTYTLDWQPGQLIISYDGKQCLKNTSGAILGQFTQQYFINMFMAQGMSHNEPSALTPPRAQSQIDWVRVWA